LDSVQFKTTFSVQLDCF